ncbi:MAG: hypothetical protein JRG96_04975 [Deltaproteobacteria bacterium]|nr:hypothetical protein [Deltaproteobacteria bacterium]MBW2417930.1 hypothetical protein [Deltaproteobacteria bacterium]
MICAVLFARPMAAATHPINIGHRGGYALAPENTIPTFLSAIANGIDVIETDVWLSLDGVPVIHHDLSLWRITGDMALVTQKTLAELKLLDVGIYFGPEWAGTRIPTTGTGSSIIPRIPPARHPWTITSRAISSTCRPAACRRACS